MSTKLRDGRRVVDSLDVFELSDRLRELLNPIRDRLDAELVLREALLLIDRADLAGKPRPSVPVAEAYLQHREEQAKMSGSSQMRV